jgi:GGDEF domain-containing protein
VNILASLEKQSESLIVFAGFILIGIIGFIDYLIGYEFAFSVFYVLPISLVTWFTNQRLGFGASVASAMVWLIADITTGQSYSSPFIPFWNSFIRFAFFIIITLLLSSLKSSLELAHTDHLTSAINSRYFYEITQMEINRFQRNRHPFTVAYIDLDNFKTVNDRFGHISKTLNITGQKW